MTRKDFGFHVVTEYCTQATSELIPAGVYDIYITIQIFDVDKKILSEVTEYRETVVISSASCGVILDTDFDDAMLTGWTTLDDTINGVGRTELINGEVRLYTTEPVTQFDEGSMMIISESVTNPEAYADGTMRIDFHAALSNPYVAIGARLDDASDAVLGYSFNIVGSPISALILQRGNGDGTGTTLASTPYAFLPGFDYKARASFIGNTLELTVWPAVKPEPAPQLSYKDQNPYLLGGQVGFLAARVGGSGFVDVSFDNVTFTLPDACNPCPADLTGDGKLNFFDIQTFLAAFSTQQPPSDWNADGVFNFFDLQAYLAAFNAGCP